MKTLGDESVWRAASAACTSELAVCGIDMVDLPSFGRDVQLGGNRFLERIFTPQELAFCGGRLDRLAARFAAKEATSKALGTGMRGIGWHEIEVVSLSNGQPLLRIGGRAARHATQLGIARWSLSLTHTDLVAAAFVVATLTTPAPQN